MSEYELSEYARKAGLYVTQIKEWRDICINANDGDDVKKRSMQKELKAVQKENSELKKDLRKRRPRSGCLDREDACVIRP